MLGDLVPVSIILAVFVGIGWIITDDEGDLK